jgi:copper transport protein
VRIRPRRRLKSSNPGGRPCCAVHYGFLLAAAGGGLFLLLVLRGQHVPHTLLRGLLAFVAVAVVPLILSLGLNGLQLTGLQFPGLLTREPWIAGAGTSLLASAIAGLLGLLLLAIGLARRFSMFGRACIGGGSLLAISSLVLTGHAATAPPIWASAPAVYVHGVAAAFWMGSLWPLWVLLDRMTAEDGVRMVRRFSSLAIGLVAALIAAGCLLSLIQLGSLEAVFATPYGWAWALKMALVVPLVGLAMFNRQVLLPNLAKRGPTILLRSIVAEAVLLAAIVSATSFLGQTPPPRALASEEPAIQSPLADQGQSIVMEIASGDYNAQVEISPATKGQNTIAVAVLDGKGTPVMAQEMTTLWSLPAAGIEGLERPLAPSSNGQFSGEVELPVSGRWLVQVDVLVSDFEKAVFRTEAEIPDN